MAGIKIGQEDLILGFLEVFRKVGYEGANMQSLADASGLRKSSLYHRFPSGKRQMAEEVLKYSGRWVLSNIVNPLKEDGEPNKRMKTALDNINALYDGGENACILKALSTESGLNLFAGMISGTFESLIDGFAKLAIDFGHDKSTAKSIGEEAVIKIQGSLILSRGMNDNKIFNRALKEIEAVLTKR